MNLIGKEHDKSKVPKRKTTSKPLPNKKLKMFQPGVRKSSRTQAKSKLENTHEDPVNVLSEEEYHANNYLDDQENSTKDNDSEKEESSDAPPHLDIDSDPYEADASYISHYYSSTSTDGNDVHDELRLKDPVRKVPSNTLPKIDNIHKRTQVSLEVISYSSWQIICHYTQHMFFSFLVGFTC